jgi:hypothetical protein
MARGAQVAYSPDDDGGGAAPADPSAADPPSAEAAAADPAPTGQDGGDPPAGEAPAPAAEPEEPKKPKSPVAQLQGRVGHLTKTLHEKDAELTSERQRREALEALLAASGKTDPETPAPAPAHSSTLTRGSAEWQEAVRAEAKQLAAVEAFNKQCNDIFAQGVEKHGDTFKEAAATLNALGMMDANLVQAAIATGAAAEVINALGSDVDEAQRITALPPVAMAVELTKLATKLSGPKESRQVSRAPAPINPVGGAAKPEVDIYDPKISMDEYVARRKAQGSPWAR